MLIIISRTVYQIVQAIFKNSTNISFGHLYISSAVASCHAVTQLIPLAKKVEHPVSSEALANKAYLISSHMEFSPSSAAMTPSSRPLTKPGQHCKALSPWAQDERSCLPSPPPTLFLLSSLALSAAFAF